MSTIELQNVCKSYPGHGTGTPMEVLRDISFKVQENEFVSIIGSSGCGKTTLLKIMDGLVRHDSGNVLVGGKPVNGPGIDRAVVFQNYALLPWATVLANAAFPLKLRGVSRQEREERAMEKLRLVGLAGFENHYPSQLSGGMQQRVGLARALVSSPEILLMDEPFGALDPQTRRVMQDEMHRIFQQERKSVVFVTHDMDEAVYLSDRVVILAPRPGRVAEILRVPLDRPRTEDLRATAQFAELTNYVWHRIRSLMRGNGDEVAEAAVV